MRQTSPPYRWAERPREATREATRQAGPTDSLTHAPLLAYKTHRVLFTNHKPIIQRCASDTGTKLRLRYAPWYLTAEAATGVNLVMNGRPVIMLASNEYLGLSRHPRVVAATKAAVDEWGSSSCGSRPANGGRAYHLQLEEALAAFLGVEACHVLSAGFLACMCGLSGLARRGDIIVADPSIHACIWDGAQLSTARIERFDHNSPESLATLLAQLDPAPAKLIAVDGVYSMEGHIAPLPQMADLADKYRAALIVDDAHGLGVLGREGRGTCDHHGVTDRVDLIAGSFSKSLASIGGFVAGRRDVIEFLRTYARQILFSAALSPASAAAALAALQVSQAEPEHRERLWTNVRYLRGIYDSLGVDYWQSPTPALPIVVGDKEKCYRLWKSLLDQGFFTVMAITPGVPPGKDLLRTAASASHTTEQLDQFGDALKIALKKAGIKPRPAV